MPELGLVQDAVNEWDPVACQLQQTCAIIDKTQANNQTSSSVSPDVTTPEHCRIWLCHMYLQLVIYFVICRLINVCW